ncbi:MAG TPA: FmdB family zinc ribbon protein [Acidimicrobiales bacterium]|nr:FmdB family zinc ribbon protein [Acidimicrobiales bacterium]
MPTYEYRCKSCGHQLEVQQAFTDDPLTECPECQGALRKVYGNVGISFKGSGFYKNDARGSSTSSSKSSSSSESSSSSDGGSSSDKASGSTETKTPAATSTSSD